MENHEPEKSKLNILIVTGEESGDTYAGRLARSFLDLNEGIKIEGIGGPKMREAGARTFYDISQMSVMGILPILGRIRFFFRVLAELKARIANGEYDAVVLIDYPEFNMKLAEYARGRGVPVFYYVCPQVWAWRRYRTRKIARNFDLVFVVFPFEQEFYEKRGIKARFLGHPILDEYEAPDDANKTREEFGANSGETLVGIAPGSRNHEVKKMLPVMLEATKIIQKTRPVKLVIPCAKSVDEDLVRKTLEQAGVKAAIVKGKMWNVISVCDFLICKSGTSTLQAAITETPMVIVYKSDFIGYAMVRLLAHTKWAGLPNILAGKEVIPELLQGDATPEAIAATALPYITDVSRRNQMRDELKFIHKSLGQPGASSRAAKVIVDYIKG
ncbi:Lipid-A-disaccharide synthase [hydrothermal vent metagenome]|uniref:lipid-A-disaccharide synthase n=1 Tax=hydrothermal vent metagenome TaxID=652676 RepID=A0A3B1CCJ9_9ZZZZ